MDYHNKTELKEAIDTCVAEYSHIFAKEIRDMKRHGETLGMADCVDVADTIGCLLISLHSRIELLHRDVKEIQEKQKETDAFRFN